MADKTTMGFASRFFAVTSPSSQQLLISESLLKQPMVMPDPNADRTDQLAMLTAHRVLAGNPIEVRARGPQQTRSVDNINKRAQEMIAELGAIK